MCDANQGLTFYAFLANVTVAISLQLIQSLSLRVEKLEDQNKVLFSQIATLTSGMVILI